MPLDLFPHTEHCELVVRFERLEDLNWDDSASFVDGHVGGAEGKRLMEEEEKQESDPKRAKVDENS